MPGIQIVSGDPLKHIDDAAKVKCVLKNAQFQSVVTVMASFAKGTIGAAICPAPWCEPPGKHPIAPTLLPNFDGSLAIRGQQLAENVNHFCLQKAARFCTLRTAN